MIRSARLTAPPPSRPGLARPGGARIRSPSPANPGNRRSADATRRARLPRAAGPAASRSRPVYLAVLADYDPVAVGRLAPGNALVDDVGVDHLRVAIERAAEAAGRGDDEPQDAAGRNLEAGDVAAFIPRALAEGAPFGVGTALGVVDTVERLSPFDREDPVPGNRRVALVLVDEHPVGGHPGGSAVGRRRGNADPVKERGDEGVAEDLERQPRREPTAELARARCVLDEAELPDDHRRSFLGAYSVTIARTL